MFKLLAFVHTVLYLVPCLSQVLLGYFLYLAGSLFKHKHLKLHGIQLAISADQNANVLWVGHPDETISSRIGRAIVSGKPKWYIKYLLHPFVDWCARRFGDDNHCIKAIEHHLKMETKVEIWKWHY